ncbi:unnamed protein product, partial [Medioppia subpectinata]
VTPARTLWSNTAREAKMEANLVVWPLYLSLYLTFTSRPNDSECTRDQIVAKLSEVADSEDKYRGDAFVMMFIGYGYDEKIIGWSAQPQRPPAPDDLLPIRDIVDMFSEHNCRALRQKTKMFVFNCCREKLVETTTFAPAISTSVSPGAIRVDTRDRRLMCVDCEPTLIDTITTLDTKWKTWNRSTNVIYACAEELQTWYNCVDGPIGHVSVFGQALSHTIAQYSWYKTLYQLFLMTVKRMDEEFKYVCYYGLRDDRPTINMFTTNKKKFPNDLAKKCRIFSEFTLVRNNTEVLAKALDKSGQAAAAKQLRQFNQSDTLWPNKYDIYLDVTPALSLRTNTSQALKMDAKPRGVALVFVIEPDLYLEAERFSEVAKLDKYKGDAFVMMFIGHGYNERIIGWSAQPQWPPAPDDVLPIKDIVAMFCELKCRALREKTKVFIFNCCRERFVDTTATPSGVRCHKCKRELTLTCAKCEPTGTDTMASLDPKWKAMNKQTHVIYACAQGSLAWYRKVVGPIGHVSLFGQAFSHTIAQYSGYKSLYQLFTMSGKRLKAMGDAVQEPEINMFAVDSELYFNPGQYKAE